MNPYKETAEMLYRKMDALGLQEDILRLSPASYNLFLYIQKELKLLAASMPGNPY